MSEGYYRVTYISEQERQRRLEEQRKRQEEARRRKEEERRRQLEEQKRRRLEAERKKREQDLIAQQQKRNGLEKILDSKFDREKAHLNSRLLKIQAIFDSRPIDPDEKQKISNELSSLGDELSHARESQLKKLNEKIVAIEQKSQQLESLPSNNVIQKPKISRAELVEKWQTVKQKIDSLAPELVALVHHRIKKIDDTLSQFEDKLTSNFDLYFSMLKNLEAELYEIKKEAERNYQKIEAQRSQVQEQIAQLLARLDVIVEKSQFESQRQQAIAYRNALEDILQKNDISILINGFNQFQSQVRDLEQEFDDYAIRENDRQFILQQTSEVLKEMGYEVLHEPHLPDGNPMNTLAMNFKAPAGQGVRIEVGMNQSVHGQFCQLVPRENPQGAKRDEQKLSSQCQKWCKDYIKMVELMKTRGINLERHWHFETDLSRIDRIEVPAAVLTEIEAQISEEELMRHYYGEDQQQRRTMK